MTKAREGAKVRKRYGAAQTPYQRLLAAREVDDAVKTRLRTEHQTLNPVALRREIEAAQEGLWRLAGVRITHEATTLPE